MKRKIKQKKSKVLFILCLVSPYRSRKTTQRWREGTDVTFLILQSVGPVHDGNVIKEKRKDGVRTKTTEGTDVYIGEGQIW